MSDETSFPSLIRRVRSGDASAAEKLVRDYEPAIRRAVRVRLADPKLQRVLDSMDICQSVLGNFFVRVALGEFELEQPADLLKLLVTMARNKLRDHARKHRAARRDHRRQVAGDQQALEAVAGNDSTPSQHVTNREWLEHIRAQLTEEERSLAEQRAAGRAWADIAAEHGGTPDALRIKLARALNRIMVEANQEV